MDETVASASVLWNDVERCVSAWLDHPHDQQPRPLAEFLPAGQPALRRLVLGELVKADMDRRSSNGLAFELERYLEEFPELVDAEGPPLDLICEEFHLRTAAGETTSPEDFCRRFPQRAAALRRVLGVGGRTLASTAAGRANKSLRSFHAGDIVDDFELQTELGRGAFGCVFLARQQSLQRQVAVKISADQTNEPQIIAQLDHPRIVRVFDQRLLPAQRLRLLYMEYAPGGTLADVVQLVRETPVPARTSGLLLVAINEARRKGRLPPITVLPSALAAASWPQTVCQMGAKLAEALHYAHSKGVLHRDIKPANVLLGGDGWPKLADFNTSYGSKLDGATPAAHFGGSLAYMSPEQMEAFNPHHERRPEEVDGRSDLYSLAIVLWELLHGERPFADGAVDRSLQEKLLQMTQLRRNAAVSRSAPLRDPAALRLEETLLRALEPEPSRRPATGAELARQLRLCLVAGGERFVDELRQGWRRWALARPILALAVAVLPPFVLAAAFNFWYNLREIIGRFAEGDVSPAAVSTRAAVHEAFWTVQWFVNGLFFPLAIALVSWYFWPVVQGLWRLHRGEPLTEERRRRLRRRILGVGGVIVTVGGVGWLLAGLTFPLATEWFLPVDGLRLPPAFYGHFVISMAACGAFSSSLPYLAAAWMALRVYLPRLLGGSKLTSAERAQLEQTGRKSGLFVLVSFVAPMLAMLLLTLHPPKDPLPLLILIGGGLVGAVAAYAMNQAIQDDLQILLAVLRASDGEDTVTDSTDLSGR